MNILQETINNIQKKFGFCAYLYNKIIFLYTTPTKFNKAVFWDIRKNIIKNVIWVLTNDKQPIIMKLRKKNKCSVRRKS